MATALALPPDAALRGLTPAQLHPGVMRAVAEGHFTILDLFDSLPWLHGPTAADWTPWRAFLAALYALPMTPAELAIYRRHTGRREPPTEPATEAWVPVGRRGRKSAVAAVIGLWTAAYAQDLGQHIAPGETAVVPILSVTKDKAEKIRQYLEAILAEPRLSYLLDSPPAGDIIPLRVPAPSGPYRVDIVIRAAKITAGRSDAIPGALLDEVAYWRSDESKNPDKDIVEGITPGMANIPKALILGISSPYARRGLLWEKYQEHYGKDGRVLVWQAPTLAMHDTPEIRAKVAEAEKDDPVAAAAEYGAEFRADVEAYVSLEAVQAATKSGEFERPFVAGNHYFGFVDPAGGTGDPFAWAIGHWDGKKSVLDVLRQREPPYDPTEVTKECATDLQTYQLRRVTGDHWGGEWPAALFRICGVQYDLCDTPKSDIYREWLPHLNAGKVDLLDDRALRSQLVSLDRRTARGGRDSIDHLPGGHDDLANAAAGCLLHVARAHREPELQQSRTIPQLVHAEVMAKVRGRLKDIERRQRRGGGSMGLPSNG